MTYLLDANTLIEAKNRYYQMSICPGYWDWLHKANQRLSRPSTFELNDPGRFERTGLYGG